MTQGPSGTTPPSGDSSQNDPAPQTLPKRRHSVLYAKRKGKMRAPAGPVHHGLLSRLPLRVSLIIVMMLVSAFGMTIAAVVVTSTLSGFMQGRMDASLESAARSPQISQGRLPAQNLYSDDSRLPTQFYVQVVRPNGSIINYASGFSSSPNLDFVTHESGPVTVPAARGSKSTARWRARAVVTEQGSLVIVAMSMEEQERTISRMIVLEVGIGLFVMAVLLMVSWYLVHRSLRPLSQVEKTAGKIANGDLTQRLPPWPKNTEVGHLASSLNKMLAQIEQSFEQVERSEAQAQENARVALKAEKQSREAEETMRRFIGDASHELRTPLTSVRGYAELFTSGRTDDANFVLGKISEESARMHLLVEDLLALARMDDSRPLAQERVDLLDTVLGIVQNTRVNYPDRDVSMTNQCAGPPVVRGDSARLHQVFTNLTNNALKHAGPDAKVRVTLEDAELDMATVKNADQEGVVPAVKISVSDTGVGIAPEDCAHIFERFYRADSSRSRHQGGGSGLGLAIVQGLVEQHHGTVSVSSVVGEGTTFTVIIPRELD